jgi:hypothetical protein
MLALGTGRSLPQQSHQLQTAGRWHDQLQQHNSLGFTPPVRAGPHPPPRTRTGCWPPASMGTHLWQLWGRATHMHVRWVGAYCWHEWAVTVIR